MLTTQLSAMWSAGQSTCWFNIWQPLVVLLVLPAQSTWDGVITTNLSGTWIDHVWEEPRGSKGSGSTQHASNKPSVLVAGHDVTAASREIAKMAAKMKRLRDREWQRLMPVNKLSSPDSMFYGVGIALTHRYLMISTRTKSSTSGSVFVFTREDAESTTFSAAGHLTASDPHADDYFGAAIYTDDQLLLVGATGYDQVASSAGAVYVFQRSGDSDNFTEVGVLLPSLEGEGGTLFNRQFGSSLALCGNDLFVGATGGGAGSGYVYIYHVVTAVNTTFKFQYRLKANSLGSWFGFSLSCHVPPGRNTMLAVGAHLDDELALASGAVFVFEKHADGQYVQQTKFTPGFAFFNLGTAVSFYNNDKMLFAGSSGDSQGLGLSTGSVTLLEQDRAGHYTVAYKLYHPDAKDQHYEFGYALAVRGDVLVVSAVGESGNSGAVYVYRLPEASLQ